MTHDARTIRYPDPLVKVNDTIQLDIATSKIMDHIRFDSGKSILEFSNLVGIFIFPMMIYKCLRQYLMNIHDIKLTHLRKLMVYINYLFIHYKIPGLCIHLILYISRIDI